MKNPVLICVATVVEVIGDHIKIVFDGWKGSKYTYRYDSRDIFPVGWCYFSGHPLQPPGDIIIIIYYVIHFMSCARETFFGDFLRTCFETSARIFCMFLLDSRALQYDIFLKFLARLF